MSRLRFYPLILVVSFSFATANRFYSILSNNTVEKDWLILLHIIFGNLNGLINAGFYGLTRKVQGLITEKITGKRYRSTTTNI
jgi:hypothetical protein